MRAGWRNSRAFEKRWPGCVAGSALAHLGLVGACVLFQPASEHPRPVLRVRLVEEVNAPAPPPVVTDIVRPPAPTKAPLPPRSTPRRVSPRPAPRLSELPALPAPRVESPPAPTPPIGDDPPVAPSASPSASVPTPSPPAPPAPVMVRLPESLPGPLGGDRSAEVPGPSVSGNDERVPQTGGGSGSSTPAPASESEPRGVYVVSGRGNGSGVGGGSGFGSGSGNRPGQGPGAGWGERAGAGDGSAGADAAVARGGNAAGSGARDGIHLLRIIRSRIERVWTYPDEERRDGMEGTVWLRFRIAVDGSVASVEVDRSSGHALLDEAAITAVRRAGPYPPYGGPIRYPFTYRLDR